MKTWDVCFSRHLYSSLQEKQDMSWAHLNSKMTYKLRCYVFPSLITSVSTFVAAFLVTEEEKTVQNCT